MHKVYCTANESTGQDCKCSNLNQQNDMTKTSLQIMMSQTSASVFVVQAVMYMMEAAPW